jgi:hypothetical protein
MATGKIDGGHVAELGKDRADTIEASARNSAFDWLTDAPSNCSNQLIVSQQNEKPAAPAGLQLLPIRQQNPIHKGGQIRMPTPCP